MKPAATPAMLALPILVLPVLILLGSCTFAPQRRPEPQSIASPNGEPLGYVTDARQCESLLDAWFLRIDADGDGMISLAEMQADARRWFARADTDGNGVITVTELTQLRRALEPRREVLPPSQRRSGQFDDSGSSTQREVDPVMAADVNLDFRVTPEEMLALTERRYVYAGRRGAYDRAVALADCERRRFR